MWGEFTIIVVLVRWDFWAGVCVCVWEGRAEWMIEILRGERSLHFNPSIFCYVAVL
jgi:hypothetical protein